jgi:hypothetical protein
MNTQGLSVTGTSQEPEYVRWSRSLGVAIEELKESLEILNKRLDPILAPPHPEKLSPPLTPEETPNLSPICHYLREHTLKVNDMHHLITHLLREIQI